MVLAFLGTVLPGPVALGSDSGWLWRPRHIAEFCSGQSESVWLGPQALEGAAVIDDFRPRATGGLLSLGRFNWVSAPTRPRIWLTDGQALDAGPSRPSAGLEPGPANQQTDPASSSSFATPWFGPSSLSIGKNLWYARVDYYEWRESIDSVRLLRETGPLVTIGFFHRDEVSRFRAEIFGGRVDYDGHTMDGELLETNTDYIGFRAQCDLIWPLRTDAGTGFLVGLGTRLWNRNLADSQTASGVEVIGYNETWWTVYPYVGLESRQPMGTASELFATLIFGYTAFTHESVPEFDVILYPKMGPMIQAECGIQGQWISVSAFFEVMQWYTSDTQGPMFTFQPESVMVTVGLNAGVRF